MLQSGQIEQLNEEELNRHLYDSMEGFNVKAKEKEAKKKEVEK